MWVGVVEGLSRSSVVGARTNRSTPRNKAGNLGDGVRLVEERQTMKSCISNGQHTRTSQTSVYRFPVLSILKLVPEVIV
jgi:hypothetical protein